MAEMLYRAPWPRQATERIGVGGTCIYCDRSPPGVVLTDEHIIADGLGGDLVYPNASCLECAAKTGRFEQQVITGPFQYARGVVGARSRKRRSGGLTARVQYSADDERELPLKDVAPFLMSLPISDRLPGILTGEPPEAAQKLFRLGLFGRPNWLEAGRTWTGASASFKAGFKLHLGVLGQFIAKTAHAYACAKLGGANFRPLLQSYILAHEPEFDAHLMGIYGGHGEDTALHQLTLSLAVGRRRTVVGYVDERVYMVGLRIFANQPTPTFLAVVGRPIGSPLASVPVSDLRAPI